MDEYDSDEEILSEIEEINRKSLFKLFSSNNPIKITDSNEKELDVSASTDSSRNNFNNYKSFLVKRKFSQAKPNSV